MPAKLRPGLPAESYQLGELVGIVRPSFRRWAIGILPAVGWCLLFVLAGAVFGLGFVSEPFAFLLNLGWVAFLIPILLPLVGLYYLGRHLARNLRGTVLILDGGIVLVPGLRSSAKVYRWADARSVQDGSAAPTSQSSDAPATVFAAGGSQFTAHMSDGVSWVFGSDLDGFPHLLALFKQRVTLVQPALQSNPAEPISGPASQEGTPRNSQEA